jgi:Family of unknown function (DUF6535)
LFSAAVAALVTVSIQDLRPNSQDTSAFYLANIYQLLADPNISRASILATPAKPPPFSPPKFAIWVNALWFLSLAISLTCALLATLLQQWARRYVTITQPPRYSPHKRARIRAFFANGIDKLHFPLAVEALPTLLHVSLFLFFSGLLVFLFNINHTVFSFVVWWVGLSGGVYGCITLMPIFRHDSPYYAPLSLSAWFLYSGVSYGVFRVLVFITSSDYFSFTTWERFRTLEITYRERLLGGIMKTARETASRLSAEIDDRVLKWAFDAADEDHELERFFRGIPSFCRSNEVAEPRRVFAKLGNGRLAESLAEFLDRTWSSSLLSEKVKERRLMVCMQAADALDLPLPTIDFLIGVSKRGMDVLLRSVQLGRSLRSLCHSSHSQVALYSQGIVAGIIARVPKRDDRWKSLVMDHLSISEGVLRDYLAHGDSVLLANLIHITRQFFRFNTRLEFIQPIISKFDIQNTLPRLQHDFCALWNEVAQTAARERGFYTYRVFILRHIRHIYVALHQGTDAAPTTFSSFTDDDDPILRRPSSYPLCNIPGHQTVIGSTGKTTHPPTITSPTLPPPDVVLNTVTPSAAPDLSPYHALTPDHSRIDPADEPSLHDIPHPTAIIEPSHCSPPVNVENNLFTAASPNSLTAIATQGPADTATISPVANSESDPRPALAASTSIPLVSLTLPSSSTIVPQRNTDLGSVAPSMLPGISLSSFPTSVPGDVIPAESQSSSASPISRIVQVAPVPGLPHSTSAIAISFSGRRVTFVSQLNTAPNEAASDIDDNSQTRDLSINTEAPQHTELLGMSDGDIATELLRDSLDTVPSSRDIDRPE